MATHSSVLAWKIPGTVGPGGLPSMGSRRVGHDKRLSSSSIVLVLPYINMNLRRCTRVPHPEHPSHLPPHTIPLGHPSAPAPSFLYPASNLDWRFISYMILSMFQCHSPKSSHPLPLPQSPKDCPMHLCLFCSLAYRVILTIFLNSIYMH